MAMTYASLVLQLQAYLDRTDTSTTNQFDNFILNAHNRLCRDLDGHIGLQTTEAGEFVAGGQSIQASADWVRNISFYYVNSDDEIVILRRRSPEYCLSYVRDSSNVANRGDPKFYAIVDSGGSLVYQSTMFITPPPVDTYDYVLTYVYKPAVISTGNQTNWFTTYVPDLLLFAIMSEASSYLKKENEMIALWESKYTDGVAKVMAQNNIRKTDRYSDLEAG